MAGWFRRIGVIAIVIGAATEIVSGCGSTKAAQNVPSEGIEASTTTTSTRPVITKEKMTASLLTISDMPPGYTPGPPSSGNAVSPYCDAANASIPKSLRDNSNPESSVTFTQSQLGPVIGEYAELSSSSKEEFAAINKALLSCVSAPWSVTDSQGTVTNFTLAPMSFPKLGDESAAYKLTGEFKGGSAEADVVFIRQSNVVMVMLGIGVMTFMGGRLVDATLFADLSAKAVAKMGA